VPKTLTQTIYLDGRAEKRPAPAGEKRGKLSPLKERTKKSQPLKSRGQRKSKSTGQRGRGSYLGYLTRKKGTFISRKGKGKIHSLRTPGTDLTLLNPVCPPTSKKEGDTAKKKSHGQGKKPSSTKKKGSGGCQPCGQKQLSLHPSGPFATERRILKKKNQRGGKEERRYPSPKEDELTCFSTPPQKRKNLQGSVNGRRVIPI